MQKLYNVCRYLAGFLILFYGFAKLNDAQFTVIESELDKPLREVQGFWLTWYYFSYSHIYGNLIAVLQVLCGVGLLFRKTTLISALGLMAIMANILLVDYFFEVPMQGFGAAIFITCLLLVILWQHKDELLNLLWVKQSGEIRRKNLGLWILRIFIIVFPAWATYYVANNNNRKPTPVDGKWSVIAPAKTGTGLDSLQHIYFERNRAYMVVFKYPQHWEKHHFEVKGNQLTIWDKYMEKGEALYSIQYSLQTNKLILSGNGWPYSLLLEKSGK